MRRLSLLILLAGAIAFAPTAAWASGVDVIRDCTDNGVINDAHGPKDYADALANLPSDVAEYTDCGQVISDARRNPPQGTTDGVNADGSADGGGGGGGTNGGAGSRSVKAAAASNAPNPVAQGLPMIPPARDLAAAPAERNVPIPLIVTAVLILLALATWLAVAARRRARRKSGAEVHRVGSADRVFPRRA